MIHPTFAETLKTTSQKHVILNAVQLLGLTLLETPGHDLLLSCGPGPTEMQHLPVYSRELQ